MSLPPLPEEPFWSVYFPALLAIIPMAGWLIGRWLKLWERWRAARLRGVGTLRNERDLLTGLILAELVNIGRALGLMVYGGVIWLIGARLPLGAPMMVCSLIGALLFSVGAAWLAGASILAAYFAQVLTDPDDLARKLAKAPRRHLQQ